MIRKHERALRHEPDAGRYCHTGVEELVAGLASLFAPEVGGAAIGDAALGELGINTALGAGAADLGAGAAAGAVPGWASAEGGAGYLGGQAADAAALGAGDAGMLSSGVLQDPAIAGLPGGGASFGAEGILSPASSALGLGANVAPTAGSSLFPGAAAGAAGGAAAGNALTTNVAPSATPTGGQIGTAPASAPEAPPGTGETPGLPSQPGQQVVNPEAVGDPGLGATQQPAPITEGASRTAPLTDQARLAAGAVPPGATNLGTQALQKLGILDGKGGLGQNALPALGLIASQLASAKSGKTLSGQLKQAAGPTESAANTLLGQGLSGQVSPAIQASIMQQAKDAKEAIRQQYANMGRDPNSDSAALAAMSKVDMQAQALIAQQAQQLTSQGLQAAQISMSPTTQAAMAAAQQDQQLSQSMANVMQQMALLQAMQGRGAPAAA